MVNGYFSMFVGSFGRIWKLWRLISRYVPAPERSKFFNVICCQKWKIFTFMEMIVKNGKYCQICKLLGLSDFTICRPLFFLQILPLENIVSFAPLVRDV